MRFLAGTPAEQLPLADGSFDAVVSQYGIEYSDMERSVPEAVRVLAPGGRLRFACHAAEGSVAADTGRAILDADFLDHLDIIGMASQCFAAVSDVERGRARGPFAQTAAQGKYASFRRGLQNVAERIPTATDTAMLTAVHRSLTDLFEQRNTKGDDAIQAALDDLRTEVDAHRQRERALVAAAQTSGQITALAERLRRAGLTAVEVGEQREGDDVLGHLVEGRMP